MMEVHKDYFIELYDSLSPKIYRIALLYCKDEELAKDILQDVFLMLWNNKPIIEQDVKAVEAYLFQCAKNKSIDALRKSKSQKSYIDYVTPSLSATSDDTENTVSFRILEQEINSIIDRLPSKCRTVYQLSRNENLDNKTIAFQLNISEKTVKNHLTRALFTLRTKLKPKN